MNCALYRTILLAGLVAATPGGCSKHAPKKKSANSSAQSARRAARPATPPPARRRTTRPAHRPARAATTQPATRIAMDSVAFDRAMKAVLAAEADAQFGRSQYLAQKMQVDFAADPRASKLPKLIYRLGQAKPAIRLAQQQDTAMARHVTAVKPRLDPTPARHWKPNQSRVTIRHRRTPALDPI